MLRGGGGIWDPRLLGIRQRAALPSLFMVTEMPAWCCRSLDLPLTEETFIGFARDVRIPSRTQSLKVSRIGHVTDALHPSDGRSSEARFSVPLGLDGQQTSAESRPSARTATIVKDKDSEVPQGSGWATSVQSAKYYGVIPSSQTV
ncbi:hypothetical protein Tco_0375521 [Tanacetum coccineum]